MSIKYKGKLYYEYNHEIDMLIRLGRFGDAEKLLREIITVIESANDFNLYPSTWYYSQLANIYRLKKDITGEIKTLEMFVKKNPDVQTTLHQRLENMRITKMS